MNATDLNILIDEIAFPLQSDKPALRKAMKGCKWQMRGPNGEYVGLSGLLWECAFVEKKDAQVFDGRDNPCIKFHFWSQFLGGGLTFELV